MLTIEQILLHMCSDMYSYSEYLTEIGKKGKPYFTDNNNYEQKEWSKWFIGR